MARQVWPAPQAKSVWPPAGRWRPPCKAGPHALGCSWPRDPHSSEACWEMSGLHPGRRGQWSQAKATVGDLCPHAPPRHLEPTASDTRLRAVVRAGAQPVVCPVGPGGAVPLLPALQQGAPRGDPARSPRAKGLVTAARGGHRQASRGEKRGPLRLGGVTGGEPAEAAGGSWPPGPRPLPCHVEATRGQRGQPVLTAFAPSCWRLLSGTRQTIRKLISGRDNHGRFPVLRRHSRSTCKGPAGETGRRCGVPGSTGHKHGCYRS